VARIRELGRAHVSVTEIDKALHREGYTTSTGKPWPSSNDGCVIVRTLLKSGIAVVAGGNARIARFAETVAAQLGGNGA
jgi:hypothetical protein